MEKPTKHDIVTFYTKIFPRRHKKYDITPTQNKTIITKNSRKNLYQYQKKDDSLSQKENNLNSTLKSNTITTKNSKIFRIVPKSYKKAKFSKISNNSQIQPSFSCSNNKTKLSNLNANKSFRFSKIKYDKMISTDEITYLNKEINITSSKNRYDHTPLSSIRKNSELPNDKNNKSNHIFYSSNRNYHKEKKNYSRNKLNTRCNSNMTDSKITITKYKYVIEDCNNYLNTIPNKPNNHRIHRIKIEDSKNDLTDIENNKNKSFIFNNCFQLPKKEYIVFQNPTPSLIYSTTNNIKEVSQLFNKGIINRKYTPISDNYRTKITKVIKNFNSDFHYIKKPIKTNNNTKKKIKCEFCHQYIDNYVYKIHFNSHPSKIFEWLYLGTFKNACNIEELNEIGITHILNCAYECHNEKLPKYIKEMHLKISDVNHFNLLGYFEETNKFMNDCKLNGGIMLVHCKLGISRSATFIIAFLIKYYRFTVKSALNFVKQKRKQINPNFGFMLQLEKYEKLINEESKKIYRRRLVCDKI